MLSIGEFSNICKVSKKTLRYYAEIGLLFPSEINSENGYRYYSIDQLKTMLFIDRLKSYHFSLEEIKEILTSEEPCGEKIYAGLLDKRKELKRQMEEAQKNIEQLDEDLENLKQGKSIMSYLENIDVQLTEVSEMNLLSVREMVCEEEFAEAYGKCFGRLFQKIADGKLTVAAPPMVQFHSAEYTPLGLDTEFAVPVREYVTGTRDFTPGLCLKTVVRGSYRKLPSVYVKQREWAEREGYVGSDALYEVYVTDPAQTADESGLITEVYYPIKKERTHE